MRSIAPPSRQRRPDAADDAKARRRAYALTRHRRFRDGGDADQPTLSRARPTRPARTSTRTPTPRRRTSCRSRASTTSSSGWATPARRPPTTARCGASRRSRSAGLETKVRDRASYLMVAERHPPRAHGATDARRRDRRARPSPRRRRARHRVPRRRRRKSAWRETTTRGAVSYLEPAEARRRRGRRAAQVRGPHLWRGHPLVHRPARLPRRLRPGLPQDQEDRARPPAACHCSRSTTAWATSSWAT